MDGAGGVGAGGIDSGVMIIPPPQKQHPSLTVECEQLAWLPCQVAQVCHPTRSTLSTQNVCNGISLGKAEGTSEGD